MFAIAALGRGRPSCSLCLAAESSLDRDDLVVFSCSGPMAKAAYGAGRQHSVLTRPPVHPGQRAYVKTDGPKSRQCASGSMMSFMHYGPGSIKR
eukprot:837994-Prymnesium_polylepis.1